MHDASWETETTPKSRRSFRKGLIGLKQIKLFYLRYRHSSMVEIIIVESRNDKCRSKILSTSAYLRIGVMTEREGSLLRAMLR